MDMKNIRVALLLSVLFAGSYANDFVSTFHCARDAYACSGAGVCNVRSGDCACAGTAGGYDCSIANVSAPCVDSSFCHSAGEDTCYRDAGIDMCACKVGFSGPNCASKSYKLDCSDGNNFKLTWIPTSAWTAKSSRYPAPYYPVSCINDHRHNIYSIPFSSGTACGVTTSIHESQITFNVSVIFQYSPNFLGRTDNIVNMYCTFDTTMEITGTVIIVDGKTTTGPPTETTTPVTETTTPVTETTTPVMEKTAPVTEPETTTIRPTSTDRPSCVPLRRSDIKKMFPRRIVKVESSERPWVTQIWKIFRMPRSGTTLTLDDGTVWVITRIKGRKSYRDSRKRNRFDKQLRRWKLDSWQRRNHSCRRCRRLTVRDMYTLTGETYSWSRESCDDV